MFLSDTTAVVFGSVLNHFSSWFSALGRTVLMFFGKWQTPKDTAVIVKSKIKLLFDTFWGGLKMKCGTELKVKLKTLSDRVQNSKLKLMLFLSPLHLSALLSYLSTNSSGCPNAQSSSLFCHPSKSAKFAVLHGQKWFAAAFPTAKCNVIWRHCTVFRQSDFLSPVCFNNMPSVDSGCIPWLPVSAFFALVGRKQHQTCVQHYDTWQPGCSRLVKLLYWPGFDGLHHQEVNGPNLQWSQSEKAECLPLGDSTAMNRKENCTILPWIRRHIQFLWHANGRWQNSGCIGAKNGTLAVGSPGAVRATVQAQVCSCCLALTSHLAKHLGFCITSHYWEQKCIPEGCSGCPTMLFKSNRKHGGLLPPMHRRGNKNKNWNWVAWTPRVKMQTSPIGWIKDYLLEQYAALSTASHLIKDFYGRTDFAWKHANVPGTQSPIKYGVWRGGRKSVDSTLRACSVLQNPDRRSRWKVEVGGQYWTAAAGWIHSCSSEAQWRRVVKLKRSSVFFSLFSGYNSVLENLKTLQRHNGT